MWRPRKAGAKKQQLACLLFCSTLKKYSLCKTPRTHIVGWGAGDNAADVKNTRRSNPHTADASVYTYLFILDFSQTLGQQRKRTKTLTTCPLNWQGMGSSLPLRTKENDSENSPRMSDSKSIVRVTLFFFVSAMR